MGFDNSTACGSTRGFRDRWDGQVLNRIGKRYGRSLRVKAVSLWRVDLSRNGFATMQRGPFEEPCACRASPRYGWQVSGWTIRLCVNSRDRTGCASCSWRTPTASMGTPTAPPADWSADLQKSESTGRVYAVCAPANQACRRAYITKPRSTGRSNTSCPTSILSMWSPEKKSSHRPQENIRCCSWLSNFHSARPSTKFRFSRSGTTSMNASRACLHAIRSMCCGAG